jgi:HEAT repeat protein
LTRGEAHDRCRALRALAALGPHAAEAVPEIIPCLEDRDLLLREPAAEALGAIGPAAEVAVPVLQRLMLGHMGRGDWAHIEATRALGKIASPAAVEALVEGVADSHPEGCGATAVEALALIGPEAVRAVPVLLQRLQDPRWELKGNAIRALARIDPTAALPAMSWYLDAFPTVPDSRLVAQTLSETLPGCKPVLRRGVSGIVRRLLKSGDPNVLSDASVAAGFAGMRDVLPQMVKWATSRRRHVRTRMGAICALGHLGGESEAVCRVLIGLLADEEAVIRLCAQDSLITLGGRQAVRILKEAYAAGRVKLSAEECEKLARQLVGS